MSILIVDDEPVIRRGLVKMIERHTIPFKTIYTADNGSSALEIVKKREPRIVITDIRMKIMDGLELCERIHELNSSIQVVVISGFNDFEYAQKCMAYGVKRYILKPFTQKDIHDVLDILIDNTSQGYVPITRYMDWIENLEQSLWMLQENEMAVHLDGWSNFCLDLNMDFERTKQLMEDCVDQIIKRTHKRNWKVDNEDYLKFSIQNKADVVHAFRQFMLGAYEKLQKTRKGNYKDPMEEAKAYIDKHLSEDITLEEVAERVGFTPTYFSSLFKRITNETFIHYRIKKRMELACQLLAVPHMKITDIASKVGYVDYPHFTKTFKKVVGISPSEYRCKMGIL